jgi:hypothetical protein
MEVINQCMSDVCRTAMLQHVLPEGKVRQEGANVTLELIGVEILGVLIGLCFYIVGE